MYPWIVAGFLGAGMLLFSGCRIPSDRTEMAASDESGLTAAIHHRLQADPQTAACWVSVSVQGDTAIVRGRVANPGLRERVLMTVRETPGVRGIDDQLFVR